MPLNDYGVLACRPVDVRREDGAETPHYQVHAVDEAGVAYRLAINVRSQQDPPDVRYVVVEDFRHPLTDQLAALASGWHPQAPGPGALALDYIRGNVFDVAALKTLPSPLEGADNDLADLLDHYVQRAISDPSARLFAFGQGWGPEADVPDKIFGFLPGRGVHDIHMNQGSGGRFMGDNGPWQDGGLLIEVPASGRWVAIFLAFQSESLHTDDATGNPISDAPGATGQQTAAVRVAGAFVNPEGPAPEQESVLLVNASPGGVDLTGWSIADRAKTTCPVPAQTLGSGATALVGLTGGVALGNNGGTVTLLDAQGLKVTGVAYTAQDAGREGWMVTF